MPDVSLRRATPDDAPFLHAIRQEPAAQRFQPLRSYSLARLREMLALRSDALLDREFAGKTQWVVLADAEPVGWITLDVTSREHGVASVGYTLATAAHGRGIATAAVQALTILAFATSGLDLQRLEAVAAITNIASQRVLEKAGFQREGVASGLLVIGGERVDHVRYGLLRTQWSSVSGG